MNSKTLKLPFTPMAEWCVSDNVYSEDVALYNAKEKRFYTGEVTCDGEKLTIWYDCGYGDIDYITDYTDWYYMRTVEDDDMLHDEETAPIDFDAIFKQQNGIIDVMYAHPCIPSLFGEPNIDRHEEE